MDKAIKDLIVVHIDGGICSQINFIAYGLAVANLLGDKARIKFDISWFKEDGKDCNGRFARSSLMRFNVALRYWRATHSGSMSGVHSWSNQRMPAIASSW